MVTIRNTTPASSTPWPSTRQPQPVVIRSCTPNRGLGRTLRACATLRGTRHPHGPFQRRDGDVARVANGGKRLAIDDDRSRDDGRQLGRGQHAGAVVLKPVAHLDAFNRHRVGRRQCDTGRFFRGVVEEAHRQMGDLDQIARAQRGFPDQAAVDADAVAAVEVAHDQPAGPGQKLGVAARQPGVAVADVAAGIATDRHALAQHQLALAAAIVEHQPTAHVVAPNCFTWVISALSATRRASRSALISASAARRNGTTPSASPPRSSSTG